MKTLKTNSEHRGAQNAAPMHPTSYASYTDRKQIAAVLEDQRRGACHGSYVISDLISSFEVSLEPNWMRFIPLNSYR